MSTTATRTPSPATSAHAPSSPPIPHNPSPVSHDFPDLPTPENAHLKDVQPGHTAPVNEHETLPPITPRQQRAIHFILRGHSDVAVAAAVGVSRRTIYNWRMRNPAFRQNLDQLRREIYQHTTDRLRRTLRTSINLLMRQLRDPNPLVAFRSARAILTLVDIGSAANPHRYPT